MLASSSYMTLDPFGQVVGVISECRNHSRYVGWRESRVLRDWDTYIRPVGNNMDDEPRVFEETARVSHMFDY